MGTDVNTAQRLTKKHVEEETGTHLADIHLYVTDVPFIVSALYPAPAFAFQM